MKRLINKRSYGLGNSVLLPPLKKWDLLQSDKLRRTLDYIAEPGRLRNWIEELRQDPAAIETISSRSYLHANGFYKITLWDSPEYKLRLHSRNAGEGSVAKEHVHNHRWAFASQIFSGGYRMRIYAEADKGERYRKHRYLRLDSHAYRVEFLGDVRLAVETEWALCAGSSYVMLPTLLHNLSFDGKAPFFSLVVTAPAQRPDCLLYSRAAYDDRPVVNQSLAPETVRDRLNHFLSLL